MPSLPPPIKGELFYDGVWNEASVRTTSDIEITRGLTSESDTSAEPMETICDLESGRDMLYAPRNPESPLFGKIGRNTPFRLSLEAGGPFVKAPGSGVYEVSTPDNGAFDITGDIDIRIDVKPDAWNDPQALVISTEASNIRWFFVIGQDNELWFWWSPTGLSGAQVEAHQEEGFRFANGERVVLRVTLDVDNDDGGWTCRFWYAKSMDAEEWTQIGPDVSDTGVTSLFNATAPILLGDNGPSGLLPDGSSGFSRFAGEIYGLQVWDGFNDQLVVDLDTARDGGEDAVGGSTIVDATGFTWTRSGVATFSNLYHRSVGEIPSWPPSRDLTGNAIVTSIAPTGITRRMDAGNKPIDSALLRWLKDQQPLECWPCTDGKEEREGASLVDGRPIINELAGDGLVLGSFGTDQVVDWLEPVYATKKEEDNVLIGLLPRNASEDWSVDIIIRLSGHNLPQNILKFTDEGSPSGSSTQSVLSFTILHDLGGGSGEWVSAIWESRGEDSSSQGLIWSPNFPTPQLFDGEAHHLRITGTDQGTSVDIDMYIDGEFQVSGSVPFGIRPLRKLEYAMIYVVGDPDDQVNSIGYITYWDGNAPSAEEFYNAFRGYPGETTSERILRLAAENNYVASVSGLAEDEATLSLQERQKLLELLQTASDANFGYLLERRDELEIYHRGQSTLWSQAPVFTLDFTDGVIGSPFKPVDDDKLTENDVTVRGTRDGSPSRYILEEGELSVQDFPNGVGRYDQEYEYILDNNEDIDNAAYMRLNIGTYNGVRYTRITLDLANKRVYAMLHKILRADIGDKLRLINIPKDHGPGPVDLIIQGYSEVIGPEEWRITFNCVPGEPWSAGQVFLDGEVNSHSRIDTAGCVSGATADTTQDSIELFTTAIYEWTSRAQDYPFDVRVGGEIMTFIGPGAMENLNPFFDNDISDWVSAGSTISHSTAVVNPDPRARGSMLITPTGGGPNAEGRRTMTEPGSVIPGVQYTAAMEVYSQQGWTSIQPAVNWHQADGTYISTSSVGGGYDVDARKWTHLESTFTAPALASRAVLLALQADAPASSDIWYAWAARMHPVTASSISDTFSRTETDTWGTAESGQTWSFSGGAAADYDVADPEATHSVGAVNSSRYSVIPVSHTDQDVYVELHTDALATGASQFAGPVLRFTDFDNNYSARLAFQTNQAVSIVFNKRVGAVQNDIGSVTLPWTHAAGRVFGVRFRVDGSTLRAKAWPIATTTEPTQWHLEVTDSDLSSGGNVGVRSTLGSGSTNTLPFTFTYDNFETVANQRFSVTRSENNVVKSHVTGEDARLAVPSYVQM